MPNPRVVITGYGAVTPIGYSVAEMMNSLDQGVCATAAFAPGFNKYSPMHAQVYAPVTLRDAKAIPRTFRRTMSPMSIMAVQAAQQALQHAGIDESKIRGNTRLGCIMGSTTGSPQALARTYELLLAEAAYMQLGASEFFQCISHTVALNIGQFFGILGVVSTTAAACASGLQAVGAGYDQISLGRQDVMICGGGEELHETTIGSFDILYAASTKFNQSPSQTPRPFDAARDGLVVGEGAGVLVLESLEHAQSRGAKILAEIVGYHTCGNGTHISQSDEQSMMTCMRETLATAGLSPKQIGYVNAHATGTTQGDAAEAAAIRAVFGPDVPVSSLKGNMGHTLGASGPIELIATLEMLRDQRIRPTHNLAEIDPACAGLRHIQSNTEIPFDSFLKNSFAFGGINSAIACTAWR